MKKLLSLLALAIVVCLAPGCWKKECCKEGRETGPQQHLNEKEMK